MVFGHYDMTLGSTDAASDGSLNAERVDTRPQLRTGEVLELVPRVIVTQHSGDRKANQFFLRGFKLDHGTNSGRLDDRIFSPKFSAVFGPWHGSQ